MTHKTLKEAYESIGLKPKIGDVIQDSYGVDLISWVDGWYFDTNTVQTGSLVYNANIRKWKEGWTIKRDGKQIYPKVMHTTLESELITAQLESRFLCLETTRLIEKLIDAKIKEAKGA